MGGGGERMRESQEIFERLIWQDWYLMRTLSEGIKNAYCGDDLMSQKDCRRGCGWFDGAGMEEH